MRHRLNSGVTIEITGKIDTASAEVRTSFLPGKSSRAIAYAQNIASTTAMDVAISEMPMELRRAGRNRSFAPPVKISW